MGMGERKRRGGRFGRRKSRRVRDDVPHSGYRRHGNSSGGVFSCCCGAPSDPCEMIENDIIALHQTQQQMLASFKQQTKQMNLEQENPDWHVPRDQEQAVANLQTDQLNLFNEILIHQSEEKDPKNVEVLYKQQCELIDQMRELQSAGYAYPDGIPSAKTVDEQKTEGTAVNENT